MLGNDQLAVIEQNRLLQAELDLARREREILSRELEVTRRKLALAQANNANNQAEAVNLRGQVPEVRHFNSRTLADLISEFSGTHDNPRYLLEMGEATAVVQGHL